MKRIAAILLALSLTGCAHEYAAYAEAHKAQAQAQSAKYAALAEIAKMGDTTAKVAAVMSINGFGNGQQPQINAPRNWADYALSFTGAILPVMGQVYAVRSQTNLGIIQSNNATALGTAQSNNATTTATNTANAFAAVANTSATGMTSIASSGFTAVSNTATAGLNAATIIAGKIQAPQPNITLSGTGVIGNGTYTQTTMSGTGVLGTGTYTTTDTHAISTSTSTSTNTTANPSTSTSLTCTTGPC
jgi:hypothetical protein